MLALLKLHHISLYRLKQPEKYIQAVLIKLLTFSPHFMHKMLHYLTQLRPADHLLKYLKPSGYNILRYFKSLTVHGTFSISSLSFAARWFKIFLFEAVCFSALASLLVYTSRYNFWLLLYYKLGLFHVHLIKLIRGFFWDVFFLIKHVFRFVNVRIRRKTFWELHNLIKALYIRVLIMNNTLEKLK